MLQEDRNKLMLETTETAFTYIKKVIKAIEDCVEYYQTGQEKKAFDLTIQIIDAIKWITDAMNLTKEIHKENIDIGSINEHLIAIVDGFENKDYILVCDLLDYEIKPIIKEWMTKLMKTNMIENN